MLQFHQNKLINTLEDLHSTLNYFLYFSQNNIDKLFVFTVTAKIS
jgi:hypothetical protein